MAKTEKAGSGIFDGAEIQGLDDNFGLIVPGSGEPDDKKDSEKEKKVDKEIRSPRGLIQDSLIPALRYRFQRQKQR